ncbi:methyltransferase domain-containing protein [Candidatus Woesearchaeota archaeon]|nr:methyltransferase domain-containing protein [Candidatus Woesearchaeota archaeon]
MVVADLAPRIIEHSFELPLLEELVKDTEGRPLFTQISHGLQAANQMTLWELYLRSGLPLPKGAILDAGCGDGLFFALAPHMVFNRPEIGRRRVIGIDLDPNKIKTARIVAGLIAKGFAESTRTTERPEGLSLAYLVQDPQDLARMDTEHIIINWEKKGLPEVAMVWSNSMFHWIREPENKYAALDNFNSVLQPGGVLCISMSAGGTARDFLDAYNHVIILQLRGYDSQHNPRGYHRVGFETDPIGSRPLDEIVNMIEESGFDVAAGIELPESITYDDPRQYSRAVEVYGSKAFLRPVPHYSKAGMRKLWGDIEQEFLNILRKKGWKDGQPWTYTQFNNYIVAVKKAEVVSPEKRVAPVPVTSFLNERFLNASYKAMLSQSRRNMTISLSGNQEEVEGVETTVNIHDIFKAILTYATSNWVREDVMPVCTIQYRVAGEQSLVLGIDVKPTEKKPVQSLFRPGVLKRLQQSNVGMSHTDLENGIRRYEFNVPLF